MQVLNDELFAILVLMALFTTFITTPTVMAIYKPARASRSPYNDRKLHDRSSSKYAVDSNELRILAWVHTHRDTPSIINLIETIRGGTKKSPLKLYILHLIELTERSSAIVMFRRARRNGLPCTDPLPRDQDQVSIAFEAYGQVGRVCVRPMTAVSAMPTMHEDVCNVAKDKSVSVLVVPFHKHRAAAGSESDQMENVGPGWQAVNRRVMKEAPCSVAVLVDRGFGRGEQVLPAEVAHGVCVLFFGGPDDREALDLAGRMAGHPGVSVTAVTFVDAKKGKENRTEIMLRPSPRKSADGSYTFSNAIMDRELEEELDEEAVAEFRSRTEGTARYEERSVRNVLEAVLEIGRSGAYELIVVGKGQFPSPVVAELAEQQAEHQELGPIGDALASSSHAVVSSLLVIQKHAVVHSEEKPVAMVLDGSDANNGNTHEAA